MGSARVRTAASGLSAWLLVASGCASSPDLDLFRDFHLDLPRAAAAGDERFVPRAQDLPRPPPAGGEADPVMCWDVDQVDCLFCIRPRDPGMASYLCCMDSPVAAREALRRMRESYADPKESIWLPRSEPGLTYVAVVDREREDAGSFGADAVVAGKRVGNVRVERKGRHVLLVECRGLWMPPDELESFLAPFVARMEEWQPSRPAP